MTEPSTARIRASDPLPWVLFLGFLVFYCAFAQANLNFDSASFITRFDHATEPLNPMHPFFGRVVWVFFYVGGLLGFSPMAAGTFHSALFVSAAVGLFYALLRRVHVSLPTAALYAALLGLNATTLEHATCLEIYAAPFLATLLSLHAYWSVLESNTTRSAVLLYCSCVIVLSFHVGYAFWILALYLSLAWRDCGHLKKSISWIGQGGLTLVPILIWFYVGDIFTREMGDVTGSFFGQFWRRESGLGIVRRLVEAPLFDLAQFAGLVIFPAAFGLAALRSEEKTLFRASILSALFFWAAYSFWVSNFGRFYFPLVPLFGLISALVVDRIFRRSSDDVKKILLGALAFYFVCFIFIPRAWIGPLSNTDLHIPTRALGLARWITFKLEPPPLLTLGLLFWVFCGVSFYIGSVWRRSLSSGADKPVENPWESIYFKIFAVCAVVMSLAAYMPRIIDLKRPDDVRIYLEAYMKVAPKEARLVTGIAGNIPTAFTGHEAVAPIQSLEDAKAMHEIRRTLSAWLREAESNPKRPVIFDDPTYQRRLEIWGDSNSHIDLPLDQIIFKPLNPGQRYVFHLPEFTHAKAPDRSPDIQQ